jgi:hypothetical protein
VPGQKVPLFAAVGAVESEARKGLAPQEEGPAIVLSTFYDVQGHLPPSQSLNCARLNKIVKVC